MPKEPRTNISKLTKISGVSGERTIQAFTQEEQRVDDLKIEDYRKMLDNDGQVVMIWNALVNTITSAGVEIQEDDDYEAEEDSEEKKFIEECLFTPVWKGGMKITFDQVNRTMLRGFVEGVRLFEVVYKLSEDGKIRLNQLAPRSAGDDSGIKIIVDDNGNYGGFHQKLSYMGKMIDVEIKNEGEVLKALKVTYGEEFGSLYGKSGLKSAHYHYDKAHKGMFLNHVGHEFGVNKLKYLKTKGNLTKDQVDAAVDQLTKIQQSTTWTAPENQAELLVLELSNADIMKVGKEMVNLHYALIAKSVLAQFVDLGGSESKGGSRALGESQVDFFKDGLQNIATILIENPWNLVIATLIKLNFGKDLYPKLKVNKIADNSAELLYSALIELVKKGEVTDSVKKQIIVLGGKRVGMEIDEDEIEKELVEKEEKKQEMFNSNTGGFPPQKEDVKMAEVGESEPLRQLYPDEEKVNFIDIKNKLQSSEDRAKVSLRAKLNIQKEEIVEQYIKAARDGRKAIRRTEVQLMENERIYSEELRMIILEMLEYGKLVAAEELDKDAPTTSKKDRQAMEDEVDMVLEEQMARLKFRLQNTANDSLIKELPENDTRLRLEEEYDTFFDTVLYPTIYALLPKALNMGRSITFEKFKEDIFAYRYTAVMDSSTTDLCRSLDGKVFQETDPDYAMLTPPNHFGCRSIWTAITNKQQEVYNYKVDGKPAGTPVYSSISTFRG